MNSGAPKLLFQCEQKRNKLRRIVRDISRFFQKTPSSGFGGSKSGPFAPKSGLVFMPNGSYVPEAVREDEMKSGDFEFEAAQDIYLLGELGEVTEDCRELLQAIEHARWDDCEDLFEILIGRLDDIQIGDRVTRRKFDPLCDEFHEALTFIQTVEFASLWIPAESDLLTPEQFQFVDRKIAEQLAANPQKLFSIDPRYFEELMASIYADMEYEVTLTKRTGDGGRDIIALSRKNYLSLKLIIECKRYARHRKVTVSQVRALFGVMTDENVTKALLATTSGFTRQAREFAQRNVWKLDLADHDDILRMIRDYARKAP